MADLKDDLQSDGVEEPGTALDQNQGVIFDDDDEQGADLDAANENDQDEEPADDDKEKEDPEAAKKKEEEELKSLPDYVKKRIDKKHFEQKQAERRAEQLAEENRILKERFEASTKQQDDAKPFVPPMPDPFDADFDQKVKDRDAAIAKQERWLARQEMAWERQRQELENQKAEQQQNQQKLVANYADKLAKSGFEKEVIIENEKVVAAYITSQDFRNIILQDDTAPAIINYLGSNLEELEKMSKMTFPEATRYLYADVLPKAQKIKPASGKKNPPPNFRGGNRLPDKKHPSLNDVQFE